MSYQNKDELRVSKLETYVEYIPGSNKKNFKLTLRSCKNIKLFWQLIEVVLQRVRYQDGRKKYLS